MYVLPYLGSYFRVERDEAALIPTFAVRVSDNTDPILSEEHQHFEWFPYDLGVKKLDLPYLREGMRIIAEYLLNHLDDGLFEVKLEM